jgi:hypothetical protein
MNLALWICLVFLFSCDSVAQGSVPAPMPVDGTLPATITNDLGEPVISQRRASRIEFIHVIRPPRDLYYKTLVLRDSRRAITFEKPSEKKK